MMKNFLLLILMCCAMNGYSQSSSEVKKELKYDKKTTQEDEMIIEVEPNTDQLSFQFMSEIQHGELKITIQDPNGKKEGGFHLKSNPAGSTTSTTLSSGGNSTSSSSSSSSNSSSGSSSTGSGNHAYSYSSTSSEGGNTSGLMNKMIQNPIAGKWKVVIQTRELKGQVRMMTGQMK